MNWYWIQSAGLLCLACAYARGESGDSSQIKATVPYRNVGGHPILVDVIRPNSDEVCPIVVWIHGGALIMGHREEIHPAIRTLVERHAWALVSIDYRLAPETKLPEIISDIEAAFLWLSQDGAKRFRLDSSRIVVAGASAGGYLALTTGYRVQPKPQAIVSLFGYGELTGDWYMHPSLHPRHNARKVLAEEAAKETDGTVISDARNRKGDGGLLYAYYRQTGRWPIEVSGFSPETLRAEIAAYEPRRHITSEYPPTLLIHGTLDTDVPYEESREMANVLKQVGVPNRLISIENGEHGFGGGDPKQIQHAYSEMETFIDSHLRPHSKSEVPP